MKYLTEYYNHKENTMFSDVVVANSWEEAQAKVKRENERVIGEIYFSVPVLIGIPAVVINFITFLISLFKD